MSDKNKGEPDGQSPQPVPNFDYSSGAAELRGEIYREPEYLEYLEKATVAMRTVRLVVYAGMTSFVILAIYGFLLIYRLTTDVHAMVGVSKVITQQMQAMTRTMANMNQSVASLSADVTGMTQTISDMNETVQGMSESMNHLNQTVTLMQHSARNIDQSFGPVMGAMNRMIPFGWSNGYPGAPPYSQ